MSSQVTVTEVDLLYGSFPLVKQFSPEKALKNWPPLKLESVPRAKMGKTPSGGDETDPSHCILIPVRQGRFAMRDLLEGHSHLVHAALENPKVIYPPPPSYVELFLRRNQAMAGGAFASLAFQS